MPTLWNWTFPHPYPAEIVLNKGYLKYGYDSIDLLWLVGERANWHIKIVEYVIFGGLIASLSGCESLPSFPRWVKGRSIYFTLF
jgi:hypothetical protein